MTIYLMILSEEVIGSCDLDREFCWIIKRNARSTTCNNNLKYPEVRNVYLQVNSINRYPGLTIKYVRGKAPIIKLLDEDDDVVEELAIDKWNTDSVEEFLSTYIEYQEEVNEESQNIP